jgi:succinate dehydrogenase / fumarate reductase cytochrome b subunit
MAVTGMIWFGYLVMHLWGNLKIYAGPAFINEYGHFLRVVLEPFFGYSGLLWLVRLVLIPSFILHFVAAFQLVARTEASRPHRYAMRRNMESTLASRTMIWGGIAILVFVVFHVLDLTLGTVNPGFVEGDVHRNVVASFSRPIVVLVYELAMVAVGMHLLHGLWSMFQTLGLNSSRSNKLLRNLATFTAILLTLGNMSIPIAVLLGYVS